MENLMPVIWVIVAIVLLLFMTVKMKVHSMIALLLIAIFVAFMEGMDSVSLVKTITKGAGSTLGGVGLIIVLGAALGQLMTDCGASKKIADTIVAHCGARTLRWGVMFVGIIFGISMFFEVGFMVVVPLVVSIAKEAKIPYMYLTQTSHTENIPYALINQLELNVESHSRTLLCTQTTHPKSGQIVQESFQERFDQQDF